MLFRSYNYQTNQVGVTIPTPVDEPVAYSVGYIGPIWNNKDDRWGNFKYKFYVSQKEYDPNFDYTALWPRCVTEDVECEAIDITDYFLITVVSLVIIGAVFITIAGIRRFKRKRKEKI